MKRRILEFLGTKSYNAKELATKMGICETGMSKHLIQLRLRGLIVQVPRMPNKKLGKYYRAIP